MNVHITRPLCLSALQYVKFIFSIVIIIISKILNNIGLKYKIFNIIGWHVNCVHWNTNHKILVKPFQLLDDFRFPYTTIMLIVIASDFSVHSHPQPHGEGSVLKDERDDVRSVDSGLYQRFSTLVLATHCVCRFFFVKAWSIEVKMCLCSTSLCGFT